MTRVGWFLASHRRLLRVVHRFAHRTAKDKACWVCTAVWAALLDQPVFLAGLREGEADLTAGRTVLYRPAGLR